MKIGFIGAGAIAQAIASVAIRAGHEVVLSNSRGPESLHRIVDQLGSGAAAGTKVQAADSEVVFVSVPWSALESALSGISWNGRILVDTNNPIQAPEFVPADLHGRTSSEIVASLTPGAKVVKTLNTWAPQLIRAQARTAGGRRVQFVSGDDREAKLTVTRLLGSFGFEVIDLGPLVSGGALQQFPGGSLPALDLVRIG